MDGLTRTLKTLPNVELETNYKVHSLWKDYEKTQHKRRRAYIKKF